MALIPSPTVGPAASPTLDQARRFARQIPLIGAEGQVSLCAGTWEVSAESGPATDWQRLYLERAGVTVKVAAAAAGTRAAPLDDQVTGGDPPLPELLGALAAADALVALLRVEEIGS